MYDICYLHFRHIYNQNGLRIIVGCETEEPIDLVERHTVNQRCYVVNVLVLSIMLSASSAYAGGKNIATYDGAVDFGAQLLKLDDGCLSIDGSANSGNFFNDLKRTDVNGELQYQKRGHVVTEYPASLTVVIRILGDKCAANLSDSPSAVFNGRSFSLRLGAEWKHDLQLRPVSRSPLVAHCAGSSTLVISDHDSTVPSVTCEMTVESRGVPLDDHLIVSLFATDGTRLTRLSVRP